MLEGKDVHLSAEAVFLKARELAPEISVATVYNTLNELVAMGELLEVAAGAGPKRYDPNAAHEHHHLVCTSCGALHDVAAAPEGPTLADEDRHGFLLTGVEVVFQGLCPTCRAQRGRVRPRP